VYEVCGDASDIGNVTGFAFPSLNIPQKALTCCSAIAGVTKRMTPSTVSELTA